MVFFNEIKGKPVIDSNSRTIGAIKDFVFVDGKDYAKVSHLIYISSNKVKRKVEWKFVKELKEKRGKKKDIEIQLNTTRSGLSYSSLDDTDLLITRLVDKQIIDVDGQKIVRVNDVLLGKVRDKFCVAAVCVGTRSLLRVLGVGKGVIGDEKIIPWASVEALEEQLHDLHLKYQKSKIADLHPGDIADIIEDLSHEKRELIFDSLEKTKAAETLAEVEPEIQTSFLRNLKVSRIVEIMNNMPTNEAADILSLMPEKRVNTILNSMSKVKSNKIREIINYPDETAGAIMHTEFISVSKNFTAQQTIDFLRKMKPSSEKIYHIYVIDDKGKLMGVLSIRTLVISEPKKKIMKLMNTRIAKVRLSTDKKDIAHLLTKYNLFVLPVVDKNNVLKGVVKADEILEEIMPKSWKRGAYKKIEHKRK